MTLTIFSFVLAIAVLLAFAIAIAYIPAQMRRTTFTTIFMLLLTPALAPATIVAVPMPFGAILAISFLGGFPEEILPLMEVFWVWYLIAFPTMLLLGYFVSRLIYPRKPVVPAD